MSSRAWYKIWAKNWLYGTLREETLEVRGAFNDLLAMCSMGEFSDQGVIAITQKAGYTDDQYADVLVCDVKKWRELKERLIVTNRISCNGSNIIAINKWQQYQSEYDRQKPYREAKKQRNETTVDDTPVILEVAEEDKPIMAELYKLPQWGKSHVKEDTEWYLKFIGEYPEFGIEHINACSDYYSDKQKHSVSQWKSRLRNWMKHEREYKNGRSRTGKLPERSEYLTPEQIREKL